MTGHLFATESRGLSPAVVSQRRARVQPLGAYVVLVSSWYISSMASGG